MNLEKSVIVNILKEKYEVKIPNAGQQMEIENKKMFLSSNTYRDLVLTGTRATKYSLLLIDSLACFSVLIPELGDKLGVKNYLELPAFTAKELVKAYKKDFYPWYQSYLEELYKGLDDDDDEEETTNKGEAEEAN
jgi:hypothetical protein